MVDPEANVTTSGSTSVVDDVTAFVLTVFHLNGSLLAKGDSLVRDLGLTSARWQVLGAAVRSPVSLPVAYLARNLGLTRQAVQRVADDLRDGGFIRYENNPHHRRASLVVLTEAGAAAYDAAAEVQAAWAVDFVAGVTPDEVRVATALLRRLNDRLSASQDNDPL